MRPLVGLWLGVALVALVALVAGADLAPTGTLRAAFIADNPIHGRIDPQTGVVTGVAADITRELARRLDVPHVMLPLPGPGAVIDSVNARRADIGFLAFEADRATQVAFSEPYLLSLSAYLVRVDSSFRSSADVDRDGVRIGAAQGASQQVYVSANVKRARVEILPAAPPPDALAALLVDGQLDAFAANRQRLEDAARTSPHVRVLDDNFMTAAQAIVVERGDPARVTDINQFLDDLRATGILQSAVERANLGGVEVAP